MGNNNPYIHTITYKAHLSPFSAPLRAFKHKGGQYIINEEKQP